jgi:hypothetical protein
VFRPDPASGLFHFASLYVDVRINSVQAPRNCGGRGGKAICDLKSRGGNVERRIELWRGTS